MKILLDTNVILDVLLRREPFYAEVAEVFVALENGLLIGFVSASSVSDIYYLTRKAYRSQKAAREIIIKMLAVVKVAAVTETEIHQAVKLNWRDFEDAVQYEVGKSLTVDFIVTRNVADFIKSSLAVVTPTDFLRTVFGE